MALVLVPIALALGGGAYTYSCYRLAGAVDAATRARLGPPTTAVPPGGGRAAAGNAAAGGIAAPGLFFAALALAYPLTARALRPAFGRLRRPESVQSAVQLLQTVGPGLARHGIACTAGVAVAAAASAAYDVRRSGRVAVGGRGAAS